MPSICRRLYASIAKAVEMRAMLVGFFASQLASWGLPAMLASMTNLGIAPDDGDQERKSDIWA
jgi:hypothetical protein